MCASVLGCASMARKDCFGKCNPKDSRCVPSCSRFIECYNEMQLECQLKGAKVDETLP